MPRFAANYRYLFDLLDELGYPGWVGCEYRPKDRTESPELTASGGKAHGARAVG
jgi:hydroxypyruvate isomerase